MIPNNNLNILPFYSSLSEQNHRKFYAYNEVYPLITRSGNLLPFQINRPHSASTPITVFKLIELGTGSETDILREVNGAGLVIKEYSAEGYDLIINPAALIFPNLTMTQGEYYVEVSDGTNTWFSEVFTVVNNLSEYLKIEYWDRDAIAYYGGHIDYTAPYKNYCFVNSEIGKPEYPFKEDAQNRDGYIFIEKQISEKKYKFEFLAAEFLCDALRVVRMHDFINIHFKGKTYKVENIIFEPKWKEQGNLAVMEVEFECDTIVKKIGKGIIQTNAGDFNNDFNDDFNNN